jgi:DNA N-6-adenine-methyltransferase (Dam)
MTAVTTTALAELEQVIERGLETFVEVGQALSRIRDERLYRESHKTFEAYCRERWRMSNRHANRQIEAAAVAGSLGPIGPVPNEAVARELAPLKDDEAEMVETWRELRAKHGEKVTAEKVRAAVTERITFEKRVGSLKSSNSVEWYTPAKYIDAAREVLGDIDLDPASCEQANKTIKAKSIYTINDEGLQKTWQGRVWMNPPYGRVCGEFISKLVESHVEGNVPAAIALLNGYGFDTAWFQPLWDYPICFTDHRISFESPNKKPGDGGPANGNVFVYLGPDPDRFTEVFAQFGAVVERRRVAA